MFWRDIKIEQVCVPCVCNWSKPHSSDAGANRDMMVGKTGYFFNSC